MSNDATPPISRYPVPSLSSLPDDISARIEAVQEKSGFVPNVFLMLAAGRTSSAPSSPITTR